MVSDGSLYTTSVICHNRNTHQGQADYFILPTPSTHTLLYTYRTKSLKQECVITPFKNTVSYFPIWLPTCLSLKFKSLGLHLQVALLGFKPHFNVGVNRPPLCWVANHAGHGGQSSASLEHDREWAEGGEATPAKSRLKIKMGEYSQLLYELGEQQTAWLQENWYSPWQTYCTLCNSQN